MWLRSVPAVRRRRRAMALITLLMFSALLLLLVISVVQGAVIQARGGLNHGERLAAGYLAESGLSHALTEWTRDPNWQAGYVRQPSAWGRGTFSLHFSSGPPFSDTDSVYNLLSDTPADGPKGPATVPAHSCYLVVTGQVGSVQRQLEAVVAPLTMGATTGPLLSEGPILLQGDTHINGLESYSGETLPVTVHTNFAGAAGQASITWNKLSGLDQLQVGGDLSAVDNRGLPVVYDLDAGYSVNQRLRDQARLSPPVIQVAALVGAHTGDPTPALSGTQTVLSAGNYYLSGPANYAGDLVLQDGATVYVDGDFELTGSVTGKGGLFVNGDASLYGTSNVSSGNRVALAAEGDVSLQGFDGTAYLEGISGAPAVLDEYRRANEAMTYWIDHRHDPVPPLPTTWLNAAPGPLPGWASSGLLGNWGLLDRLNHHLGGDRHGDNSSPALFFPDMENDRVGALMQLVDGQPDSSRKSFVRQRLQQLKDMTNFTVPMAVSKEQRRDEFLAAPGMLGNTNEAVFDTVQDLDAASQERALLGIRNILSNFTVDRLGHSQFEGLVYARGTIRASHEINVTGGLVTTGSANSKVILEDGSRLTYMKEYFDSGDGAITFPGLYSVRNWYLR